MWRKLEGLAFVCESLKAYLLFAGSFIHSCSHYVFISSRDRHLGIYCNLMCSRLVIWQEKSYCDIMDNIEICNWQT